MNRLQEYIIKYQGIHDGTDPFLQLKEEIDPVTGHKVQVRSNLPPMLNLSKRGALFDGSQLGKKMPDYIDHIITKKQRAITLLDYGCGQAIHTYQPLPEHDNKTLLGRFNGMIQCYYCYDPAVKKYNQKPPHGMLFDTVCCADVMEHIPEEHVDEVLEDIFSYLKDDGTAMFTISASQASKAFKDGENLHITLKEPQWWTDKLLKIFGDKAFLCLYKQTHIKSKVVVPYKLFYHNNSVNPIWHFEEPYSVNGTVCAVEQI